MELYQLKPGQPHKLMIYDGNQRFSSTPSRFSGTWSGADHTFTISGVQIDDEAEYHCGHSEEFPLTQWNIDVQKPPVPLLASLIITVYPWMNHSQAPDSCNKITQCFNSRPTSHKLSDYCCTEPMPITVIWEHSCHHTDLHHSHLHLNPTPLSSKSVFLHIQRNGRWKLSIWITTLAFNPKSL